MEDAHIAYIGIKDNEAKYDNTGLFAVFDGHGGKEVAMFAESRFEDVLISLPAYKEGRFEDALRESFHKIDELLEDTVCKCMKIIKYAYMQSSIILSLLSLSLSLLSYFPSLHIKSAIRRHFETI